jgi:Domain of unknown function (DUF6046)
VAYSIEVINRLSNAGLLGTVALAANNVGGKFGGFNGLGVYKSPDLNYPNVAEAGEYKPDVIVIDGAKDVLEFTNGEFSYLFDNYPTLVKFSWQKHLVVTEINEGDGEGEVVEFITNKSTPITITGILIDEENRQIPYAKIEALREMFRVNDILDVSSDLFQAAGIDSLYVSRCDIEPVPDYPDTVKFTIGANSIVPAILLINE